MSQVRDGASVDVLRPEHAKPMVAFLAVAVVCGLVFSQGLRAPEAVVSILRAGAVNVVAGTSLLREPVGGSHFAAQPPPSASPYDSGPASATTATVPSVGVPLLSAPPDSGGTDTGAVLSDGSGTSAVGQAEGPGTGPGQGQPSDGKASPGSGSSVPDGSQTLAGQGSNHADATSGPVTAHPGNGHAKGHTKTDQSAHPKSHAKGHSIGKRASKHAKKPKKPKKRR